MAGRPGPPRRSAPGLPPVWVALLAVLTAACGGPAAGRTSASALNWSDRPVVMVELGNMRDALDTALLTDPSWQDGVAAAALTAGVVDYLGR